MCGCDHLILGETHEPGASLLDVTVEGDLLGSASGVFELAREEINSLSARLARRSFEETEGVSEGAGAGRAEGESDK